MSDTIQTTTTTELDMFAKLEKYDHEQVMICNDNRTGLKAIIAIHNTILGPGLGGTRMWSYKTEEDAVHDVLRLSRGMSYKAAISGLNLGGAKAVIIGDPKTKKSEALIRKFGRFVENLGGKYITAEDVGTTTVDMEYVSMETKHVVGLPESRGGGGDPSPVTAYGVYMGMKASAKKLWGNDSLGGKTVAVQGVGKVGMNLVKLLHNDGAKIYVSDINDDALQLCYKEFGTIVVDGNDIFDLDVDVFAPCALGAVLNTVNINRLKCAIVAGAANNQLEHEQQHGPMLADKGILYAPDFLINAGGLINVYSEYTGYHRDNAIRDTEKIYQTTLAIYKKSQDEGIHTQQAAVEMAEKRIHDILMLRATV